MAREIKIDNSLQKRFSQKREKNKTRKIIAYFLIVCEGEKTEPLYFDKFPTNHGRFIHELKFSGGGINTMKVVEKAIELRNKSKQKYDRVWAVFDKDSFNDQSFNNAIKKAEANDIHCAWSNESFELWYLLHFTYRNTAMSRNDYKRAIESAINKNHKKKSFRYKKNDSEIYSLLEKYGDQTQAIKRAEKLNEIYIDEPFAKRNPSTQVYKLVVELNGKSIELNQELQKKIEGNYNVY
jgi:hypothetical protein